MSHAVICFNTTDYVFLYPMTINYPCMENGLRDAGYDMIRSLGDRAGHHQGSTCLSQHVRLHVEA